QQARGRTKFSPRGSVCRETDHTCSPNRRRCARDALRRSDASETRGPMIRRACLVRLWGWSLLIALPPAGGCGSDSGDGDGDGDGDSGDGGSGDGDGDGDIVIPGSGGMDGGGGAGPEVMIVETLPPGFTPGMQAPNEPDALPAR